MPTQQFRELPLNARFLFLNDREENPHIVYRRKTDDQIYVSNTAEGETLGHGHVADDTFVLPLH